MWCLFSLKKFSDVLDGHRFVGRTFLSFGRAFLSTSGWVTCKEPISDWQATAFWTAFIIVFFPRRTCRPRPRDVLIHAMHAWFRMCTCVCRPTHTWHLFIPGFVTAWWTMPMVNVVKKPMIRFVVSRVFVCCFPELHYSVWIFLCKGIILTAALESPFLLT